MADSDIDLRSRELLQQQARHIAVLTDRMFAGLMALQWVGAVVAAIVLSPRTWEGDVNHVHPHVWLAIYMGALLTLLPVALVLRFPGRTMTRHAIAIAQVLFSSLLIQVTGGRIETHFHVFGSLAFLAFYRDWTVLIPATVVVAVDHFVRGVFWPETVFGIGTASPWRWLEHAGWVIFEDVFLIFSCIQARREMWNIALRTAELERANKDLQARTEEREQAYRAQHAIFETALDAMICMDSHGAITAWNAQAEQTFGWLAAEAVGRPLHDLIIPPQSREAQIAGLRKFAETGDGPLLNRRVEVTALHRDGHQFTVELAVAPMHQNGAVTFSAFARDITERKQAGEVLRKAKDDAEAANRAKSAFLAHMSHEIRTPLNGILGYADLLIQRGDRITTSERLEHLRTIAGSGRHLLSIINDVLDLSKIEAGENEVERVLCSPHEIIAGVVSLLRVRAREKGLELEYTWEGPVPELVLTDPNGVRQLLLNLVGNAIKFTERGDVKIIARISRQAERPTLELEVRDTGIGIPPESIERVFKPFVQADDSITRRFGGTGLGLPICRGIVESLGGSLQVESHVGQGSRFTARIDAGTLEGVRMLREPLSDIGRPGRTEQDAALRLPPCRILVVEDGEANRRLITILLKNAGAELSVAEDGQQGVDLAVKAANEGQPFDLILMDMQMPVLDGYSATRRLREIGFQTPIFALTAHAMKGDEDDCREAGCSGFLTKPIEAGRLIRSVYDELQRNLTPALSTKHPAATNMTGIAPELLEEVAGLFRQEVVKRFAEMREAATQSQWEVIARTAHWMKGSAGSVGHDEFTAPAALLEKQAKQQSSEAVVQSLDRLELLVKELHGTATEVALTSDGPEQTRLDPPQSDLSDATRDENRKADQDATKLTGTILIVDDEQFNIDLVQAVLNGVGSFRLVASTEPTRTLQLIFAEKPDVLLLDLNMPQYSGFDVLATIRATSGLENLPVLILTASDDRDTRRRALELGATDFIAKPLDRHDLLPRIRNSLLVKRHFDHLRRHAEALDSQVRLRTAQLEKARRNAIYCLARAAEFRDDDTGRHVIRVGKYAGLIARKLGWTADEAALLEEAAQLHDVGKIGVPDSILLKPGKLAPEEFEFMQKHCGFGKRIFECMTDNDHEVVRRHVEIGNRILLVEDSDLLQTASIIALTHHERWDGSGYPLGLAGEDIPLVGRITAVADVFDALSSKRSYKAAFPINECFDILEEGRGKHFDPTCLDAFFAARMEVLSVQIAHADLD